MPQCKLLLCIRGDTPRRVLTWEYMPSGLLLSLKKSEALFVILHLLHTFAMSAAELARCACKLLPGCASSGFSPRAMWPSCKTMHHIMTRIAAISFLCTAPCCGVSLSGFQVNDKPQGVANDVIAHCQGPNLVPLQGSVLHKGIIQEPACANSGGAAR